MKKIINIRSFLKAVVLLMILGLFIATSSCDEDTDFGLDTAVASYSDGIQNLDETGIDCGGQSGVNCPSCSDAIQNQGEEGIDCGGPCAECIPTPRADELNAAGILPYFYTFETKGDLPGKNLDPVVPENQGVTFNFGVADPSGTADLVGQILRPANGPFGGFEDFKFKPQPNPVDFSEFNKFTLDVYIPSSNNFTGNLKPMVEVILHDNDANFFERWTVIAVTVDEADFDSWVTLRFDGSNAAASGSGTLLPKNTTYDNITLRFGGSGHVEAGEFFIKDFKPAKVLTQPGTPRADALTSSGLPRYFTFEAAGSGLNLEPRTTNADGSSYTQGVDVTYGTADPAGSINGVTRVYRPDDGRFGGFEDFKFQPQSDVIDFSAYSKFKIDVFIPSEQDFSGALTPTVDLILHDDNDKFFERWTVITQTVIDFDTWVTLEFDGTNAAAAGSGTLLPDNTSYTVFTLRFGGAGHTVAGEFYVKDFVPFM